MPHLPYVLDPNGAERPVIVHYIEVDESRRTETDPGYPAHIEIDWIEGQDGMPVLASQEEEAQILRVLYERSAEMAADY